MFGRVKFKSTQALNPMAHDKCYESRNGWTTRKRHVVALEDGGEMSEQSAS